VFSPIRAITPRFLASSIDEMKARDGYEMRHAMARMVGHVDDVTRNCCLRPFAIC